MNSFSGLTIKQTPRDKTMNLAFLSSYTSDFIVNEMKQLIKEEPLDISCHIAPFGQWQQEVLDEQSHSRQTQPNIVIISLDDQTLFKLGCNGISQFIREAAHAFSSSDILIHNCVLLHQMPLQFLQWNTAQSVREMISRLNSTMAEVCREHNNVRIIDLQSLVEQHGRNKLLDNRFGYLAKAPFSQYGNQVIAQQLVTGINACFGKRAKCIIVDLDNVLWGGILGEEGVEHIQLSNDGIGRAFHDFQKVLLSLLDSGIILAICSKNNESDALEVLEKHPHMVLHTKHFAAWRINWQDKASNIKGLAQELNIGLDTLVFLDDSKHEREYIKSTLPEVIVPELPEEPCDYPDFVAQLPYFETFKLTDEDRNKAEMYTADKRRKKQQNTAGSLKEFLQSLNIQLQLEAVDNLNLPRISQLTQKTSQFNLTTRRYSENEIKLLLDSGWKIIALSCCDRFGDLGIIGVAMLEIKNGLATLDNFLLSCRALGRGIEQTFLALVLENSAKCGATKLCAQFIPTKKNSVAQDFLSQNLSKQKDGWYIGQTNKSINIPDWIKVKHE